MVYGASLLQDVALGRYLGERANHRLALSQSRRMSKDYERLCESSQAMISAVMSRLMLRRLARA
jgi:uncharacterized protein (UPF0262 family)